MVTEECFNCILHTMCFVHLKAVVEKTSIAMCWHSTFMNGRNWSCAAVDRANADLFELAEVLVFAQSFEVRHRLGVVETVLVVDFTVALE